MVQLKVKIRDHKEIMELTIANIAKKDIFIRHDWLQHHNPEIDWQEKKIKFSWCPGNCYQESYVVKPKEEINENRKMEFDQSGHQFLAIDIGQPKFE